MNRLPIADCRLPIDRRFTLREIRFALTPALSPGRGSRHRPSIGERTICVLPLILPLLGERAGVRANLISPNPKLHNSTAVVQRAVPTKLNTQSDS